MSRQRRERTLIDGFLLLDKPAGVSSNNVLQQVRRLYDAEKAGHTGSLDPFATGLLPICFGQATKLGAFLLESDKRYQAQVLLGMQTSTGDPEGEVIATSDPTSVTREQIEAVLPQLLGEIGQVPPMYSAIKQAGRHLYELAREGLEVDRQPRRVTIHELKLLDVDATGFSFEVFCSKGTYIRTLGEDWAALLGQRAHLIGLRRMETGPFKQVKMVTMADLHACNFNVERLNGLLMPLSAALGDWRRLDVDDFDAARLRRGLECGPYPSAEPGPVVVYGPHGLACSIADVTAGRRVAPKRWIGPEPSKEMLAATFAPRRR
ncbi:MAG: tRNA pseudouridine(55) synthase TruB [Xanthomonadaceae bacterium]|nr:tRNA pseudouridine(55) synthase TruB [Xanthomonadaceae bacterium]